MSNTRIAFCPGSFDPVTNGHVDIISRSARLFERVIVGVAEDAQKDHVFTLDERVEMCREVLAGLDNVTVESFSGLLVEAAVQAGARVLVKGLRQTSDLSHEGPMAYMNRSLRPEIETMFLLAHPDYTYVSSSLIKWVCGMGGDISAHVPELVAKRLAERLDGPKRA
ncbi:MAG: pantetheine-phosphate adenylyltransferase [Armatimonadia bacterium]